MARAKHTARAEARRRYRAQLAAEERDADEPLEEVAPATTSTPGNPRRRQTGRDGLAAPERPAPAGGIRDAFRQAFRPLNLREDLRLLPRLLTHRAFWLPLLIVVINAGVVIAFQGRELISRYAMTYFLYPPPIGAIFLAGFLAPRASYLLGLLVGLIAAVLFAVVVAAVPTLFPPGSTFAQAIVTGLATSPFAGILFAAAAAWYRRFLYLASPARRLDGRRPPPKGKPARGR